MVGRQSTCRAADSQDHPAPGRLSYCHRTVTGVTTVTAVTSVTSVRNRQPRWLPGRLSSPQQSQGSSLASPRPVAIQLVRRDPAEPAADERGRARTSGGFYLIASDWVPPVGR